MTYWPGTKTPKSSANAFTRREPSGFDTPHERAKATIAATNAEKLAPVGGHAVNGLKNLSKRAQRQLAPVRPGFCTPIEPAGSGIKRLSKTKAAI